MSPEAVELCLI